MGNDYVTGLGTRGSGTPSDADNNDWDRRRISWALCHQQVGHRRGAHQVIAHVGVLDAPDDLDDWTKRWVLLGQVLEEGADLTPPLVTDRVVPTARLVHSRSLPTLCHHSLPVYRPMLYPPIFAVARRSGA